MCQYMQQAEPSLLTNLPEKGSSPKLSLEELAKAFMDRRLALPGKDRSRLVKNKNRLFRDLRQGT